MELPLIPAMELPLIPAMELPLIPAMELPLIPAIELPLIPAMELPLIPATELPLIPFVELPLIPLTDPPLTPLTTALLTAANESVGKANAISDAPRTLRALAPLAMRIYRSPSFLFSPTLPCANSEDSPLSTIVLKPCYGKCSLLVRS
jgi:hypothetical protein